MLVFNLIFYSNILLFVGLSILLKIYPPKNINSFYGYRTSKSMSSQELWDKANAAFSNVFLKSTLIMTFILLMLVFFIRIEIMMIIQVVLILAVIVSCLVITEKV